ncbi:lipid-A-disaccharide synthase [Roseitalea porphyridii]|uniref:Lipid-A-disaccharide synthase n=1 Tax=Roseitalea porphyridii TaxID=1852022 RepID=A0A4P6UZW5_9HYPH|nr:lipid-A-disaccharide synthase [Roseitalea porphyridii]QBK30677.1 lipid-A-disaccharide synthase [Roseitalea porphyridii]
MTGDVARAPLIGIVAGETSGQLLAAELIEALNARLGAPARLIGVGGPPLDALGLNSLFDADEIALMGLSAVLKSLPRLARRIGQTADALIAAKPDCLIIVDSPDFSLRVARRVKLRLPHLPVVKYVAPTVWAWRPGRARDMAAFVDHVLAILPFEPQVMADLGGPETHYVGHRLMADAELERCWQANRTRGPRAQGDDTINLLLLPGSRRSEVRALLGDFRRAVEILRERGRALSISLPTLPHLERPVRDHVLEWPDMVRVTTGREAQIEAYGRADVALAASGTVLLELALAGVPAISCYRADPLIRRVAERMLTTWSAALPNIIADKVVINEYYDEMIRPGMLARLAETLARPGSAERARMMDDYADIRARMSVDVPPSEKGADIVAAALRRDG